MNYESEGAKHEYAKWLFAGLSAASWAGVLTIIGSQIEGRGAHAAVRLLVFGGALQLVMCTILALPIFRIRWPFKLLGALSFFPTVIGFVVLVGLYDGWAAFILFCCLVVGFFAMLDSDLRGKKHLWPAELRDAEKGSGGE